MSRGVTARSGGHFWLGALVLAIGGIFTSLWLPVIGPFIVGLIGGKIVGRPSSASFAALLPTLLTILLGVITVTVTHGVIGLIGGAIIGFAALLFIVLNSLTLLAGAFIGGLL